MPTKLGSIISYIKYIRSLLMSEPCLSMFGGQMPTWPNWPTLRSRSRLPLAFDFCQVFMVRAKICWSALAVTFGIYTAFWCSLQFYKNSLLNSRMLHSRARTRTPSVPKQLSKSTPLWHWWTGGPKKQIGQTLHGLFLAVNLTGEGEEPIVTLSNVKAQLVWTHHLKQSCN